MKRFAGKTLPILLAAVVVASGFAMAQPMAAFADTNITDANEVVISDNSQFPISISSTEAVIRITGTVSYTSSATWVPALDVPVGCTLTLILDPGASLALQGGTSAPGLRVLSGATLIIQGEGTLTATGGTEGAGIGGGYLAASGNIVIHGGTVNANGTAGGAGIGGGVNAGTSGNIIIDGGNVTAIGGSGLSGFGGGAGIGGGGGNSGNDGGTSSGNIVISGDADVTAAGGNGNSNGAGGAGIGGGGAGDGVSGGTLQSYQSNTTGAVTATKGTGSGTGNDGANIGGGGGTDTAGAEATLYTITATAGANGSISPSGTIQVNEDGNVTFTITPDSGYHIALVTVDGTVNPAAVSGSYTFSNVNATGYIIASFEENSVTITYAATTGGTVTSSSETIYVVNGTASGSTAAADSGYSFDGWYAVADNTFTTKLSSNLAFTPAKVGSLNVVGSYVARFVEDADITVLALVASPTSGQTYPGNITLTATLSGAYPDNSGKPVQFTANGSNYGSSVNTNSSGVANCTITNPVPGTYSFGASFAGDANNDAATATEITGYTVKETTPKAIPTVTLTATGGTYTDNSITLTATVGAGVQGQAYKPAPTGTITFREGNTTLGTKTLNRNGTATFTIASLIDEGRYTFTAEYSGDDNYPDAVSDPCTVDVTAFLSVSSPSLHFDAQGGTQPLLLACNSVWSLDNSASWLTIAVSGFKADNPDILLNVTATANPEAAQRTALFTLSIPGVMVKTVQVTQDAGVNPATGMEPAGAPSVIVYSQGGNAMVKSDAPIQSVAVYDVSGKLLKQVNGGNSLITISGLPKQQVLIVRVTLNANDAKDANIRKYKLIII